MTKGINAYQRLMIQRKKWINKGFKKEEYEQFEQDVINGYISEDIIKVLDKTSDVLSLTKSNLKKSHYYFVCTVLVAIIGIIISVIY